LRGPLRSREEREGKRRGGKKNAGKEGGEGGQGREREEAPPAAGPPKAKSYINPSL